MQKLLIATTNEGKIKEINDSYKDLEIELIELRKIVNEDFKVKETGHTFEDNAVIKAKEYAKKSKMITLAEDSGIDIDCLEGKLGIYSARFLKGKTDEEKNQIILNMMKKVPKAKRTARFRVAIAIAAPNKIVEVIEAISEGTISSQAKGDNGFGYDEIFIPKGSRRTYAQFSINEKNKKSFRAAALARARKILKGFMK